MTHTPLSLVNEQLQPPKLSQTERILRLLRSRSSFGASNRELNTICYRFSARIHELRSNHYIIDTIRDSAGQFRFILKREPEN